MFKLQEAAFLKKPIPGEQNLKRLLAQTSLFSERRLDESIPSMVRLSTEGVAKRDEEFEAACPDFGGAFSDSGGVSEESNGDS